MRFQLSKSAFETIERLLAVLVESSQLELKFAVSGDLEIGLLDDSAITQARPVSGHLQVVFTGHDTPALTARNGELLYALEHVAAKTLRLEPDDHDRISFDADSFKANREKALRESAAKAVELVRSTGRPYSFPPMTSRERRLLHLELVDSGLPTMSSGEVPRRFVTLYPEKHSVPQASPASANPARIDAIRNSFRRR